MKKALLVLVALMVFGAMTGVALAKDPSGDGSNMTYTESGNVPEGSEYNANTPSTLADGSSAAGNYGASRWFYKDNKDSAAKNEGGYNAFQNQDKQLYDFDAAGRDSGPHGGYDTTTNKCKTCHAVHRATGTFALMRVDTPDEACEYCHIGDHRHSVVSAFWRDGSIYPKNGHTMGAGPTIPDSSVWQWEEKVTVNTNGGSDPIEVRVRRYSATKNKLMRWTMHGGRWVRVGPTLLRCQSCHQPHNAYAQVWKPYKSIKTNNVIWSTGGARWERGYKLLRLNPSGGIASVDATTSKHRIDPGFAAWENKSVWPDVRLKVIERATIDVTYDTVDDETITATSVAGGVNRTGYTPYRYHGDNLYEDDPVKYEQVYGNVPVFETSLSFYCADCHNLNIAGKDLLASEKGNEVLGVGKFGNSMLGDRSHAVPMMITQRAASSTDGTSAGASSGFHCYTCHNNDMPRISNDTVYFDLNNDGDHNDTDEVKNIATDLGGNKQCGQCHVSPRMYAAYKQSYRQFQGVNGGPSYSDFPHSGPAVGYKLLNSAITQIDGWDNHDTTILSDGSKVEESPEAVREPYVAGADGLDKICLICHGSQGSRSVGYDK